MRNGRFSSHWKDAGISACVSGIPADLHFNVLVRASGFGALKSLGDKQKRSFSSRQRTAASRLGTLLELLDAAEDVCPYRSTPRSNSDATRSPEDFRAFSGTRPPSFLPSSAPLRALQKRPLSSRHLPGESFLGIKLVATDCMPHSRYSIPVGCRGISRRGGSKWRPVPPQGMHVVAGALQQRRLSSRHRPAASRFGMLQGVHLLPNKKAPGYT